MTSYNGKRYSKNLLELDKFNSKDQLIVYTPSYDHLIADSTTINTIQTLRSDLIKKHPSMDFDTLSYHLTDSVLKISHIYFLKGYIGDVVTYEKRNDTIFLDEKELVLSDTNFTNEQPISVQYLDVTLANYAECKTTFNLGINDKNKVIMYEGKRLR